MGQDIKCKSDGYQMCDKVLQTMKKTVYVVFCLFAIAGCSDNDDNAEVWKLLKECDNYYNLSDTTSQWIETLDRVEKMISGSNDNRVWGEYYYQRSCYDVSWTDGDSVPYYLAKSRQHYLKSDDNDGICKVLLSSVQYLNAIMEIDSARKYTEIALAYMADNDSLRGLLMAESMFSNIVQGKMQDAVDEGYSTCKLIEESGDTLTYLITTGNLGMAYRRLGMTDSAMVCYNRALNLALPFGDDATTAYIYNNLSVLYCEIKRFDEALDFAEKAIAYTANTNDFNERYSAFANKAAALAGKGNYAEAVKILAPEYKNIGENGNMILKMKYISYIVDYILSMQRTDSIDYYIGEGEKMARKMPPNSTSVVGLRAAKINYYIFKKDYSSALEELNIVGEIKDSQPMPEHKRLEFMAECYAGLGNYSKAYELKKLSAAQSDSIRSEKAESKLAEFTARYETKEKELEIEQLKKEKAIHDARIARLTGIIITLLFGLSVVAILMLYRRKTERQKKEILRARNYIAGMESERARFARELHDGACNDLLAIGMEINMPDMSKEKIAAQIRELRTSLRLISHELMPPSFRLTNLNEILESYLQHMSAPDMTLNYTNNGENWEQIRKDVAYEMYRIAQETISNVIKHSQADVVDINLAKTDEALVLDIRCNGQWKANEKSEGIGLRTIKERVLSIGGELNIIPSAGNIQISISVRNFIETE